MFSGRTNIKVPEITAPVPALHLYNYGDECSGLTGGWLTKYGDAALSPDSTGSSGNPARVKNNDNLEISIPNQSYQYSSNNNMIGSWHTRNKISVDSFNKLIIVADIIVGTDLTALADGTRIIANLSSSQYLEYDEAAYINFLPGAGAYPKYKIELDLSNITGSYYITAGITRWLTSTKLSPNNLSIKIYEAMLE